MRTRLRRSLVAARNGADVLARHPRPFVGTLIGANIVATALFGLAVQHNGWVWLPGR